MPLPLDSELWHELSHAYGPAGDIPELLTELSEKSDLNEGDHEEPMFALWSSLYHQEDVYSASYAAFPHLVEIAATKKVTDRIKILMLAAAIASGLDDPKALLREETEAAYLEYRQRGLTLFCEALGTHECESGFHYWLGSIAALKGWAATARILFSLDSFVDAALEAKVDFPLSNNFLEELRR
jgi:hypothetical protein